MLISGVDIRKKFNLVAGSSKIMILDKLLDDNELADVMELTNAVALPYKRITTSGFYFLALTFKKGIIAKDLPFFRRHSTQNTILLYNDASGLQNAFEQVCNGWVPDMPEINMLRNQFSWSKSASIIAEKFNQIVNV